MGSKITGSGKDKIKTSGLTNLRENDIIDKKEAIIRKYSGEDFLKNNIDVLNNEEINSLVNPIIVTRGVPCDKFYLVLKGKIMVTSGQEGF